MINLLYKYEINVLYVIAVSTEQRTTIIRTHVATAVGPHPSPDSLGGGGGGLGMEDDKCRKDGGGWGVGGG